MKKILICLLFISPSVKAQLWQPDTCDCTIEQDRDGNFVKFIKPCDAYAGLDDADAYQAILQENQLKNQTVDYIMQTYPDQMTDSDPNCAAIKNLYEIAVTVQPDLIEPNCQTNKVIPDFTFFYDNNRTLMINTPALTDQEINDVAAQIDTQMQAKGLGITNINRRLGTGRVSP